MFRRSLSEDSVEGDDDLILFNRSRLLLSLLEIIVMPVDHTAFESS